MYNFPTETVNQRNKRLMPKAEKRLKDAENKIKFRNICKNSKATFPMKKKGFCCCKN